MGGVETDLNTVQRALAALKRETGIETEILREKGDKHHQKDCDAEVKLKVPGLDLDLDYAVAVKRQVTPASLGAVEHAVKALPRLALLVTEYITPAMADRLRERALHFIDTAGNAYLKALPLYVFIKGNRLPERLPATRGPLAFQRAGLQILFALLCRKDLAKRPLREIAAAAGVALGTVNNVLKDLKQKGYLIDMGRGGRHLINKDELFRKWAVAYPDVLRPKILLGRYTAEKKEWWKKTELPPDIYWGGEVGAAKITKYLKPQQVTLYALNIPKDLLVKQRLKKDPNGEVEILEVFWGQECNWQGTDVVHPLLIYADLLVTNDSRSRETAEIIYDNELVGFLRED